MADEIFSKMARFISELRKEKKLTQKDLAQLLGVTDKAVSKWERALSCPDILLLPKLAEVLDVTISELLYGEKTGSSAPEADAAAETALQYAGNAAKNVMHKNVWRKFAVVVSIVSLISILVLTVCGFAAGKGLSWSILPVNITASVWIAVIFAVFVIEKNKMASVLACGFLIFITTFYYSALKQAAARGAGALGAFNGFQNSYIPHYTVILILLAVSCALAVIFLLIHHKKASNDMFFSLAAANITVVILSVLTVPSIMDYADINGLGVNPKFTILIPVTLLINCVLLALLAKRFRKQQKKVRREGS